MPSKSAAAAALRCNSLPQSLPPPLPRGARCAWEGGAVASATFDHAPRLAGTRTAPIFPLASCAWPLMRRAYSVPLNLWPGSSQSGVFFWALSAAGGPGAPCGTCMSRSRRPPLLAMAASSTAASNDERRCTVTSSCGDDGWVSFITLPTARCCFCRRRRVQECCLPGWARCCHGW